MLTLTIITYGVTWPTYRAQFATHKELRFRIRRTFKDSLKVDNIRELVTKRDTRLYSETVFGEVFESRFLVHGEEEAINA